MSNNEEARFAVTPSFVLTYSSDSDECVSTKLGVTANHASSLLLIFYIVFIFQLCSSSSTGILRTNSVTSS